MMIAVPPGHIPETDAMFLILLAAQALTPVFEDLSALELRIAEEIGEAEAVDPRLRLARCPEKPTILPANGGTVVVRCPAIGWRLQVHLKKAAATDASGDTVIIRKGQLVECVAQGAGFSVTTMMVALEDAAEGRPVRVKSPTSSATMTGTVTASGIVRL
jgi:flagellar basal body P-ring formation protein FlgA